VTATTDIAVLAPGSDVSCAVGGDGQTRCWGVPGPGRFASDSEPASSVAQHAATVVDIGLNPIELVCRNNFCCGRDATTVRCWGPPVDPNHGDAIRNDGVANVPTRVAAGAAFALGSSHTCALDANGLGCWGANNYGQLGVGDDLDRYERVAVALSNVTHVTTNADRTCARTNGGVVYCWGRGYMGDVAETSGSLAPIAVDDSAMGPASAVATGEFFSCALDALGAAWCWGNASNGTCGSSATTCRVPTPVAGGLVFAELAAGQQHACGRTAGGALYCWGSGFSGRLGNDMTSGFSNVPLQVLGVAGVGTLAGVAQLALGDEHTCVRTTVGAIQCFGDGVAGKLGNAQTGDSGTPVDVMGVSGAQHLVCGENACMAQLVDDSWVGWGSSSNSVFGDLTTAQETTPVVAVYGLPMSSVALGRNFGCGTQADGSALCWGGVGSSARFARGFPVVNDVTLP
jgi:alpha-tubulin suppressor-like RCC1 family protein